MACGNGAKRKPSQQKSPAIGAPSKPKARAAGNGSQRPKK